MIFQTPVESLKIKAKKKLLDPYLIARMIRSGEPLLSTAGAALKAHRTRTLSEDEQRWIAAIEKVRADVSESREIITVTDYGAGSPDDVFSVRKMYEGTAAREVVGEACRNYSKPQLWATVLFHFIRKFRPTACVELGTCLGVSAAYQAAALELNGRGQLVTLEGSPNFAEIAGRNLNALSLRHRVSIVVGRFQDTLDTVLNEFGKVDYVFIDGHHDERATIGYFQNVMSYLSYPGVVVFDDIAWSSGMRRAWRHIRDDPRVTVSLDLSGMGICLVGAGIRARYEIAI